MGGVDMRIYEDVSLIQKQLLRMMEISDESDNELEEDHAKVGKSDEGTGGKDENSKEWKKNKCGQNITEQIGGKEGETVRRGNGKPGTSKENSSIKRYRENIRERLSKDVSGDGRTN